jgi:hypothetical protein
MTGKNIKNLAAKTEVVYGTSRTPKGLKRIPFCAPSLARRGLDPVITNKYSTDPAFTQAFVDSHRISCWSRRMSLSLTGLTPVERGYDPTEVADQNKSISRFRVSSSMLMMREKRAFYTVPAF